MLCLADFIIKAVEVWWCHYNKVTGYNANNLLSYIRHNVTAPSLFSMKWPQKLLWVHPSLASDMSKMDRVVCNGFDGAVLLSSQTDHHLII